jgi:ubiquinone/menaquinone biosynthesis C-methylase UbiE
MTSNPGQALLYFKTLSDETRLRLLNILNLQEFNVQELVEILAMGQSRVSRHLKILQEGGLVESRRDGLWVFYRAAASGPGRRFFEAIRYLLEGQEPCREDLQAAAEVLRSGKLRSRRFFDSVASSWELMKRSIIGDLDLVGEIIRRIPEAGTVADLGCGSGTLLQEAAAKAQTAIGVDSSREMLAEASRRLNGRAGNVDLRIGELEHLPLRDGEAQTAVINMVLHHLRDPQAALLEAWRVLSEGGTLIVADLCKHDQEMMRGRYGDHWLGFSHEQLGGWFAAAGFSIDEQRRYPGRGGLEILLYRGRKQELPAAVGRGKRKI